MKCLEKDRARRYDTANGLAADLKRHLDNEPVVARPPSATYRLLKAWRRNRLVFTASAAVAAALLVGAGLSVWQALRAIEAGRLARSEAIRAGQALEVANRKTRQAEEERERAQWEELAAQRHLYRATMNLAQQSWEDGNVNRARQLLEEVSGFPDRGFEWYYWQRQVHLDLRTLRGHLTGIRAVAFSPDGRRVLTGGSDAVAKIWDTATGQELLVLKGHRSEVGAVAFFPDGERIVTGSWDQSATVWDARSGRKLLTLPGHEAVIPSVAVSGDGRWIATASEDRTARVWDGATGRE